MLNINVATWALQEEVLNSRPSHMEPYLSNVRHFINPVQIKPGFLDVDGPGEDSLFPIFPIIPDEQLVIRLKHALRVWVEWGIMAKGNGSPDFITCPAGQGVLLSSTESEESQRARLDQELRVPLLDRLKTWRETVAGKRPPDIKWPTETAFEEAERFIEKLSLSSLPHLDMGMAEDGEINFLWQTEKMEIDLGFYGSRPCSYFARDKQTGRKMRGSGFDPAEGLPDELKALFTE